MNSFFMPSPLYTLFHYVFTLTLWSRLCYPHFTDEENEPRDIQDFASHYQWLSHDSNLGLSDFSIRACLSTSNPKTLFLLEWAVAKLLSRAWKTEDIFKITTLPISLFCSLVCAKSEGNLFGKEQAQGHTHTRWVGHWAVKKKKKRGKREREALGLA